MILSCTTRALRTRHAFRISRGARTEIRNVFIRIERDGIAGYGEASPNIYYDETWERVVEKIEAARPFVEMLDLQTVAGLEAAWGKLWEIVAPSRAALCAIDVGMWDWLARKRGVSVAELMWGAKPRPVTTFCTIGLSSNEELAIKMEQLRCFPQIKIKSDEKVRLDVVRYVRARTAGLIAVDANCAWGKVDLREISRDLAQLRVAFIEQPRPPGHESDADRDRSKLPVFADESCVTEEDVPVVAAHFDGFNIKLVKCGGLTPARHMVLRAKVLKRRLMIGCMLESSALIAAGAVIAQRTEFADLDGAWLLADDPFRGWIFDRGVLTPPSSTGLGIEPEDGFFGE
jgi:L-alanine-DL-glutamate epimerase-like enolase superfamily enzyme